MLKINYSKSFQPKYTIKDLDKGDLFYCEDYLYMVIEPINMEDDYFNAVALDSPCVGKLIYIFEEDTIIPLIGELTLKKREFEKGC